MSFSMAPGSLPVLLRRMVELKSFAFLVDKAALLVAPGERLLAKVDAVGVALTLGMVAMELLLSRCLRSETYLAEALAGVI